MTHRCSDGECGGAVCSWGVCCVRARSIIYFAPVILKKLRGKVVVDMLLVAPVRVCCLHHGESKSDWNAEPVEVKAQTKKTSQRLNWEALLKGDPKRDRYDIQSYLCAVPRKMTGFSQKWGGHSV
jgi:hypothetical protein